MRVAFVRLGASLCLTCAVAFGCLLGAQIAAAFPANDASTPSIVSNPTPPTESDLQHQLQLQTGIGATAASGKPWTFVPGLGAEEFYTDNVLQSPTDRRWDLVTVVTPSLGIVGDEPNAQVHFNYAPQLRMDARTPSQNGLTQQLAVTGDFTIIPDSFYLDARALAGGTPVGTGFGAFGSTFTPSLDEGNGSLGTAGLAKQNLAQAGSISVAPYWLHRFGDTGTAKIGYEFNESTISQSSSYYPLFVPTGSNSQHSVTNEAVAQFETGERFAPYRDLTRADVEEGTGSGIFNDSARDTISNRLNYEINRSIGMYGELGYERLRFGGVPPTNIDDMTWMIGGTYAPNSDSQITFGYGHQNGVTGANVFGKWAITPRTSVSARYVNGLQSDLGQLQSQLDLTALDQNGNAVDAQTGAPLFTGLSGVGLQNGLFRAKTLSVTGSALLDRDRINFSIQFSQQTTVATDTALTAASPFNPVAPPVGSTSEGVTAIATWVHSFSEVLTINSSASYGVTNVTGGSSGAAGTGRQSSVGASVGLQYLLSQTLATNVRYMYFRRGSPQPDETIYQNVILVGINKRF
jgi:uncharacterized protein (PEP-CTERM system associated)